MYGYDPILLEKRNINEWLNESEDNILLIFDKSQLKFSKSPSNESNDKIFCLKRQFLFNPQLKELCVECILENNQLMVTKTYNSKNMYYNIGYYINKNVLVDAKNIKPSLAKKRIFKIDIIKNESKYISKELLSLAQNGLFKLKKGINISIEQKTVKKNIPNNKDVYFDKIKTKALFDYSNQWDGHINSYLRIGKNYFSHDIFEQHYKRYGNTMKEAILAIKSKIMDLDRVFLEASSKSESLDTIYFRGMKRSFDNLKNIGDSIVIPNFISITTTYKSALRFARATCCVYKIILSKGVPYINMINTTKYKSENEILLPRDLVYEIIKIEKLGNVVNTMNDIVTLKVSLQYSDQFKFNHNCRDFYLGKLISYNPSYLKKYITSDSKKIAEQLKDDNKVTIKKRSKRCPNGSRKNKLSGLCELFKSNNKTEKRKKIIKNKLPRCKNGTRRNKVTGNCEPLQ